MQTFFFIKKMIKQQFYKITKTCKNIFYVKKSQIHANVFFFTFFKDLVMIQILEMVNKNDL